MKKLTLILAALFIAAGIFFTSCKKDDTTAPVISLNGSENMKVVLGGTFTDPGATATDDQDGDITPTISGTVTTTQLGTYTLTYTATDKAGNEATKTRTVEVYLSDENLAGTGSGNNYLVHDSITSGPSFPSVIDWNNCVMSKSSSDSTKVLVSNFGGFTGTNLIEMHFTSSGAITISSQAILGGSEQGNVSGTGSVSADGTHIIINYSMVYTAGTYNGQTDNSHAVFTKQ
ncbi:MAG: DUF5011 domain-containing protein [Bacteroidales bacterium]|jgi:hypothetical protein